MAAAARTVREFKALMGTDPSEVSFIRNIKDWEEYRKKSNELGNFLEPLTENEIEEFSKKLVFNKGGIAGMYVKDIQEKLSYAQYTDLLAVFGMDIVFAKDHEDYYCNSHGNCRTYNGYICTSNC